jgi:protocatechuate 3,4-dioxygenase alpha subunit
VPDRAGRLGTHRQESSARSTSDGSIEALHPDVSVFARGLLDRVVTCMYFPTRTANAADPVLCSIGSGTAGHAHRRA